MTTLITLALDTVFEQCSVSLLKNERLIATHTIEGGRGQTEIILPMIDELLKTHYIKLSQIDILAFNRGPGAFSGIRINTAVVQALSFAHDIKCVGVSSLLALANTARTQLDLDKKDINNHPVIASCMDARQNEVYACFYQIDDTHQLVQIDDEKLLPYGSKINANFVVGDGAGLICHTGQVIDIVNPDAYDIGCLAYMDYLKNGGVSASHALPVYLRNNAWKTLAEQGKK